LIVTAVDTNVILDFLTGTPSETAMGAAALKVAKLAGTISVSILVYAEVASNFSSRTRADDFFQEINCKVESIDESTAFLAAQFFAQYKLRGGARERILPDFLIAAHAQLRADRILTRDKRFFRDNFPKLKAVSPEDLT
jgi:predicted nucleic acid-binding protein